MCWYWIGGAFFLGTFLGTIATAIFCARRRDDEPVEQDEFPRVMPRIWKGEPE